MSYEQLLHDFVDGSLDYQGETALFSELHFNEGLRSELKMLIAMGRSAAHDIEAFVPAPESRELILQRLGFSSSVPLPSAEGSWFGMLRGSLQGIFGGVIGALLAALAIFGLDIHSPLHADHDGAAAALPAMAGSPSDAEAPVAIQAPSHPRAGTEGSGAAQQSASQSLASSLAHAPERDAGRTSIANLREGSEERMEESAIIAPPVLMEVAPRGTEVLSHAGSSSAPDLNGLQEEDASPIALVPVSSEESGWGMPPISIELRANNSRSMTPRPAGLANASNGLLRDRILGVHYRIGDNHSIGLEIGQEEFYQRFEEMLANGDFVRHEQNPALFWGGAAYRVSFPIVSDLRPFAGAFIGGTEMGPVGRISAGTYYNLVPECDLFASGELSALAYSFNGTWHFTPKYGMSYGVRVKF